MKKLVCLLSSIILIAVAMPSFGYVQCPGNTKFVYLGDTIQQVIQQCGSPKKMIDIESRAAVWNYTLAQFGNIEHAGFSLLFIGNTVSKIRTSKNVPKNSIHCPRGTVVIGSTPADVVAACGQPTHIQNVSEQLQKHTGKISHLIYQPQPYLPKTTFIFKNGALIGTN